jgi:hypothetical protein
MVQMTREEILYAQLCKYAGVNHSEMEKQAIWSSLLRLAPAAGRLLGGRMAGRMANVAMRRGGQKAMQTAGKMQEAGKFTRLMGNKKFIQQANPTTMGRIQSSYHPGATTASMPSNALNVADDVVSVPGKSKYTRQMEAAKNKPQTGGTPQTGGKPQAGGTPQTGGKPGAQPPPIPGEKGNWAQELIGRGNYNKVMAAGGKLNKFLDSPLGWMALGGGMPALMGGDIRDIGAGALAGLGGYGGWKGARGLLKRTGAYKGWGKGGQMAAGLGAGMAGTSIAEQLADPIARKMVGAKSDEEKMQDMYMQQLQAQQQAEQQMMNQQRMQISPEALSQMYAQQQNPYYGQQQYYM